MRVVVVQLSISILVYCIGSIKYEDVLGEVEGTTVQSHMKLSRKLWLNHIVNFLMQNVVNQNICFATTGWIFS